MELKKNKKKKKVKKRVKFAVVIFILVCQMIFLPIFGVALAYYGPFTNVRDVLVTTAMQTMSHKYLATWFLSEEKINEILDKYKYIIINDEPELNDIVISDKDKQGIEIVDINSGTSRGKMMIVNDPSRVTLATTSKLGEVGETLSTICKNEKAIGGINAGGFGDDGGAGIGDNPTGIIIKDGNMVWGTKEKNIQHIVGLTKDNKLAFKSQPTMSQVKNMNLRDGITFGPTLVANGSASFKGDGGTGMQPRTAIGQRKDGAILLLVLDGRGAGGSIGATYGDVRDVMLEYKAYNAVNLDGGSSSSMNYTGKTITNPSDIMGERSIVSAFIVK
ncbi:MAG: phosphodiester glycosidase family protein [Clostridia bacterium]